MNHFGLILTKVVATFIWLYIILGLWYGVSFVNIVMFTLILGAISYFIGDLLIFRKTNERYNHTVATFADFFLALIVVYAFLDLFANVINIVAASFFSAVGLSVFEAYYHRSVEKGFKKSEGRDRGRLNPNLKLQTEASEEIDPQDYRKRDR
ncbi:YndM family protein [Alkalibacillus silvisoli]|uniref:DUF2512 family protein n=1 Tax=Alkalibacillus silvisoli TaxID=392823 RepID=A0ABN1A0E8_9BACI